MEGTSVKSYLEGIDTDSLPTKAKALIEKLLSAEGIDGVSIESDTEYKRISQILDNHKKTSTIKIIEPIITEPIITEPKKVDLDENIYPKDSLEFYYEGFPYGATGFDNSPESILYKKMIDSGFGVEQVSGNYLKYNINGKKYGVLDNGGEFKIDNITDKKITFAQIEFSDYKNEGGNYDKNSVNKLVLDLVNVILEDSKELKKEKTISEPIISEPQGFSEMEIKRLQLKLRAFVNLIDSLEGIELKKMQLKIRAIKNSLNSVK